MFVNHSSIRFNRVLIAAVASFIVVGPARAQSDSDTSWRHVRDQIYRDAIQPRLWHDTTAVSQYPDWETIRAAVTAKYGKVHADRAILDAQIGWYQELQDWPVAVRRSVEKMDRYGVDTADAFPINNMTWDIVFEHATDPADLSKAVRWMALVVRAQPKEPANLDTYANLLYKLGRTREALPLEEKAVALGAGRRDSSDFIGSLAKMKRGVPTWEAGSAGKP